MALIRTPSVLEQLDSSRAAVVVVRLADLMGLVTHSPGELIDGDTLRRVATAAARTGIAEQISLEEDIDPYRLLEAMEVSPLPASEIGSLTAVLGYPRLAQLVGASDPSLRRYAAALRNTPDRVAQRIHFLALLTAILRGSFNDFGIRRWFSRPRVALDERAPADLLTGDWTPDDPDPQAAVGLAAQLLA
jgi:uncharacterized protein (DUF2384 family)